MTSTDDSAGLVPARGSRPGASGSAATSGATADSGAGTLPASAWETVDELVAAVVDADRAIHAMTAWRTVLIDQARRLGEDVQRATQAQVSSTADIPRRTMVAELACALRLSERSMTGLVDTAQVLVEQLPGTLAAMGRGDLSARHAGVIIESTAGLEASDRADAESHLVELGTGRNVARFRTAARRWRERNHPVDLAERHRKARADRCVALDPADDGMAWLSALLPAPAAFAMFDHLTDAAATLTGPDEQRTMGQRRADVLTDLVLDPATRATLNTSAPQAVEPGTSVERDLQADHDSTAPNECSGSGGQYSPRVRASIHVTVPVLTLLGRSDEPGHLDGYGPIDAATARELAADAPSFTRVLTDPHTGTVLSVGRDHYTVPADLRRHLRLRDETCRFPGCGRRATGCDIDHTTAWEDGGTTTADNLAHLCRHHHRLKHHGGWATTNHSRGTLDWTSPTGRTYRTDPALPIGPQEPNATDPPAPPSSETSSSPSRSTKSTRAPTTAPGDPPF